MSNTQQEGRLRWVKASITLPKEYEMVHVYLNGEKGYGMLEEGRFVIKTDSGKFFVNELDRVEWLEELPSPLTEDELKAKFAQYIGGENYTYDQLDTRERDTLDWFIKNRQQ